jgi:sigma-B regulation protein RsbU (phosphoserine phosphatase)
VRVVSLRRRFLLLSLVYFVIVLAGGAVVLRISTQRDDLIKDQRALVADAPLDNAQQAELASIQSRLEDLRIQLNTTIGIVLGLALATTLAGAFLVRRWVTRPVERLARAVRNARAGKVGVIAPQGPPEIADLARDVDAMRLQMNRALFDAVRARETIEQSASVVLQLRSELATGIDELPDGWTVATQLHAAEGLVAGDCYDVIDLGPSALGLVVVDISGHGAVSGILALRCKELLRAGIREGLPPNEALLWAAEQLDDLADETFLTAFVAVVDLQTGAVTYASAGHPPALLCSASEAVELDPTGPIVGPFVGPWERASAQMEPGDRLAVYTDGLIEVRDEHGTEFGVQRLSDLVSDAAHDEAEAIVKRCVDEVTSYAPERLRDDITIALLCRGPREPAA